MGPERMSLGQAGSDERLASDGTELVSGGEGGGQERHRYAWKQALAPHTLLILWGFFIMHLPSHLRNLKQNS